MALQALRGSLSRGRPLQALISSEAPWLASLLPAACNDSSSRQPCFVSGSGQWRSPASSGAERAFHTSQPSWQLEPQDEAAAGVEASKTVAEAVAGGVEGDAAVVAHQPLEAAVTAPDTARALVEFTPDQSLLGGTLIGLAAASKLSFTGRILGVSGIVGSLLRGDMSAWRLAWMGGLASGALALTVLHPAAFPTLPDSYSLLRAGSAGLLVGLGTSLGSGCTSGHGICGLSRLAPRSLAATGTFMVTGATVAALAGTMAATGADINSSASLALMGPDQWRLGGSLLAGSVGAMAALRALPSLGVRASVVEKLAEAASGAVFALGLGLSGMLQPAKVAGFLSPLLPAWDPSLAFVMGGALAVSLPAFQLIKRRAAAPLCLASFSLPAKQAIDKPLLLGAAMFGAGWGLGGVCPGPGLVSLAQPTPQLATLVAAMAGGMLLHRRLEPLYDRWLGGSKSVLQKTEIETPEQPGTRPAGPVP